MTSTKSTASAKLKVVLKSFEDPSFSALIADPTGNQPAPSAPASKLENARTHRFPEPPSLIRGGSRGSSEVQEAAPATVGKESLPQCKRILLADDLLSIRQSLGGLLTREGYHVKTVDNGLEAVRAVESAEWDLVLLDLWMPGMTGWEALQRISKLRPELPILVMTAHPNQREWTEPKGAWGLMEKPLNIPLLLGAISAFVQMPKGPSANKEVSDGLRFRHWPSTPTAPQLRFSRRWGLNE